MKQTDGQTDGKNRLHYLPSSDRRTKTYAGRGAVPGQSLGAYALIAALTFVKEDGTDRQTDRQTDRCFTLSVNSAMNVAWPA